MLAILSRFEMSAGLTCGYRAFQNSARNRVLVRLVKRSAGNHSVPRKNLGNQGESGGESDTMCEGEMYLGDLEAVMDRIGEGILCDRRKQLLVLDQTFMLYLSYG